MAKFSSIRSEFTPEHVNVHFDKLPRLDIKRFHDPNPGFTVVGVTEVAEPQYLHPVSLFFNAAHHDRIERAVQAFNAVIAEAEGAPK